MTNESKNPEEELSNVTPEATESAEALETPLEEGVLEFEDPSAVLAAENAELKERALRLMAEMENLRRRTEKEVRDAKAYAVASFARDMLVVNDNLGRAIEALPEEARSNGDSSLASLIEGVEMVERDMLNQLEKHGVKRISPEGDKFDPNFHQAMFEVPNPEVPNGTVVQVVQAGYVIGDRVLRPAMVGVSKGGPKAATNPADKPAEPGSTVDKSA
ncbi:MULTISPECIES: nucleotide exchange factor GrpE [Pseudovibrio]|uniref:nucleotide exchange factor GrpE n=1 Tax=Stappiaceae TaxID=2821832 RepID=UPI002366C1FA|nr:MULTISPECIES: nucleotide exchange factor GrpE [Pseudovibrio]MDD7909782.1 nucleotide exchange factor GrpE [Pseudovibrio exalbescens]MDX5592122.1 nucleotide exchange factor GrpE [Pseudovibrio sp. SPO723]